MVLLGGEGIPMEEDEGEKGEEKQNETNAQKSIKDRVCGLQTLHLAHNSFSGKLF